MAETDELLAAIEAVHAAGLDETLWPSALRSMSNLFGAVGTTLEAVDKRSMSLTDFWAHGVPAGSEMKYAADFIAISPRTALGFQRHTDPIGYDYMLLDEAAMDRDPYYSDFLPAGDLRYFVSASLTRTPEEFSCVAVQRSRRQGHVGSREIALMRRFLPHLRQAFDVTRRLRGGDAAARSFEGALGWLVDGAALIRRDGRLLYVNEALQTMARRNDGIRIGKGKLEFAAAGTNARYAQAIASVGGLIEGDIRAASLADFPAPRRSGGAPYLVSIRPLVRAARETRSEFHADAVVFVHDTLRRNATDPGFLTELFGLTPTEAGLARAIQAGVPLEKYARERAVSLNTVYTHLRRVKEKTACKRMSELVRMLNDLQAPLRPR